MHTVEQANQYIETNQKLVNQTFLQKTHLQPPIGWMNDPNGFICINHELHLFYQFYPYDSIWGPMHWGHAKTTDGLRWEHLPVALAPDQAFDQEGCFSGTSLIDDDQLLVMYTGCSILNDEKVQQQCIATSNDYIHFKKYDGNPVISVEEIPDYISKIDFRDPKILKREDKYYCLVVTKTHNQWGSIVLFESADAKRWIFKSVFLEGNESFGEMWECPDIMTIDDQDVLIVSAIHINEHDNDRQYTNPSACLYFIGKADWKNGTYSYGFYDVIDAGLDFYAPQITMLSDRTPVMIAWMQTWERNIPTHELNHRWAGCMTCIRKLSIQDNRLIQKPFYLANEPMTICYQQCSLSEEAKRIHFISKQANDFIFRVYNDEEEISLKKEKGLFCLSRKNCYYSIHENEIEYSDCIVEANDKETETIDIILDTSSIEVFLNNGKKVMSMRFFSKEKFKQVSLQSSNEMENFYSIGDL